MSPWLGGRAKKLSLRARAESWLLAIGVMLTASGASSCRRRTLAAVMDTGDELRCDAAEDEAAEAAADAEALGDGGKLSNVSSMRDTVLERCDDASAERGTRTNGA